MRFALKAIENFGVRLVPHSTPLQQHVVDVKFPPFDSAEMSAVNLQETAVEMAGAGGDPALRYEC